MRLIDADEVLKEIKEYEDGCKMLSLEVDPRVIKQHITFAPTIDPWHYPSKGELPEKDGEYFITVRLEGGGFLNALALYYVDRGWLGMFNKPYAWQYITSPKEEA